MVIAQDSTLGYNKAKWVWGFNPTYKLFQPCRRRQDGNKGTTSSMRPVTILVKKNVHLGIFWVTLMPLGWEPSLR